MKKLFLLGLFLCSFSGIIFAENKGSFDVTPVMGILSGNVNEFVFYIPNTGKKGFPIPKRKLSELNWDVFNIPFVGAQISYFDLEKKTCLNLDFQVGVPKSSNNMVDRDWTNCVNFNQYNWLTNYSKHQNYLLAYYKWDISMGRKFYLPYGFRINTLLSVSNEYFSFYAENGYGKYGEGWRNGTWNKVGPSENGEDVSWNSKVISYEQNRIFIGLGFDVEKLFDYGLSMALSVKPRFAYVRAEDHHLMTRAKYLDLPYGFGGLCSGVNFQYRINEHHKISLKSSYDWLPVIIGCDYSSVMSSDSWDLEKGFAGGASSNLYSVSLNYTLSL